tara:strand:- start:69 stop:485 length:417 start_codon:yes stop_codon:yes gene_type:complete
MSNTAQDSFRRIPLKGKSMWPITAPLIGVIEPTQSLKRGDLATFMNGCGTGVIFHRVTRCMPEGYITRGDTRYHSDGYIPRHAILGRITRIEYKGLGFNLPATGLWAHCQRAAGTTWSWLAPGLRTRVRRIKQRLREH